MGLLLFLSFLEFFLCVAVRPNIVFILVDDTGYNDIGYHNRSATTPPRIHTPNTDALADRGVKLSNYYVQPICTPTRAALMTGRYPFRYGVNGFTIANDAPWCVPHQETFLSEYLQSAGYTTAIYGKWHLGFFKEACLPSHRGFDFQSGIYNARADHFTHDTDGGYDWHVNETTDISLKGQYSGNLVRDNAVDFIHTHSNSDKPFFLYLPFQEAHSPYQVDKKYREMYPELDAYPERQNLAGMITHNDDMLGDVISALNSTGVLDNTIVVFSSDNGGPGGQEDIPSPSRFDSAIIDRNHPFRGQKHEIYEGGVRVAGFVYSALFPQAVRGTSVDALFHITDWLPTLLHAANVSLDSNVDNRAQLPIDGQNLWPCLTDKTKCPRDEVVININTVCDTDPSSFATECPAPKAAIRIGDLKLLVECFDTTSLDFTGRVMLYNITADPSEQHDLSTVLPTNLDELKSRLAFFAKQAATVSPLGDKPPWQGDGYYCANCTVGRPIDGAWSPWCPGPVGHTC